MSDFTEADVEAGVKALPYMNSRTVEAILAAVVPAMRGKWRKEAAEEIGKFIRTPPGVEMSDYTKGLVFAAELLRSGGEEHLS